MERLNLQIQSQAKIEIARQEEKVSTILDSVPSFVVWTDLDGRILGSNDNLKDFFNIKSETLVKKKFSDLGWRDLNNCIINFISSNQSQSKAEITLSIDGKSKFLKFDMKRLEQSQILILVGMDLTEDIEKQKELDEARSKSVSSSRMALLGEMAAGIAHEINNPLTIISGFARQLQKLKQPIQITDIQPKVDKIQSTVFRITKIITSLRNFARDGSQDAFSKTSIKSLYEDVLELSQEKLKNQNIELRIKDFDPEFYITCRATQISQVLLNLINNARDAILKLPQRWIEIETTMEDSHVVIKVTDSGTGIEKEIAEKIFEPFFTTKPVGVGTGLGLSISFGIIKSHRGTFFLEQTHPNTRFVIKLPIKQE